MRTAWLTISSKIRLRAALALAVFMMLLMGPLTARAVSISCAIGSVSAISIAYNPQSSTPLTGSGSVTLNCTKSGSNSDTLYIELGAGSGLYPSGSQRRAANGSIYLSYNLYSDAGLTAPWTDTLGSRIAYTLVTSTSTTVTLNWWIAFPASQLVPAGTYSDTVTITLYQDSKSPPSATDPSPKTASFSVAATVSSLCSISSPPGNLNFSYTSFQTTAATRSSSFAVTCTKSTPYSASLDATSGSLLGLNYTLALSPTGQQSGTGAAQSMSITGTMAAGQSGTCAAASCTASQTRTLTITY